MSRLNGLQIGARTAAVGIMAWACVLAGCGERKGQHPGALVLATVGDRQITETDFKRELERRQKTGRAGEDKMTVLSDLVRHEALLQRARAIGIDADPEVRREVSNLLIGKLMDKELQGKLESVTVSSEEIKSWYDHHKVTYTRPAQTRLAVLKLDIDPKASEVRKAEIRKRMEDTRSRVLADPPRGRGPSNTGFGALAVTCSDDQASRYRGGDVGWIETGRFPPRWPRDVLEAGLALPVGQYSGVIEAAGGVYLVTKTDSRAAVMTPLAEVESAIRQHLISRKRQDLEVTCRDDAARMIPYVIDTNALASVVMPTTGATTTFHNRLPVPPGKSENEVQP